MKKKEAKMLIQPLIYGMSNGASRSKRSAVMGVLVTGS